MPPFLNLAVPRDGVTYGFSGLNMAFAGVLPIAIVRYVESRLRRPIHTTLLLSSFFVSIVYVAVVGIPRTELSVAVIAACVAFGAGFGLLFWLSYADQLRPLDDRPPVVDALFVIAVGAWVAHLSVGFPDTAVGNGNVINIYVHFLGYAIGFTTAYLSHEWQLLGERPRPKGEPSDPLSAD